LGVTPFCRNLVSTAVLTFEGIFSIGYSAEFNDRHHDPVFPLHKYTIEI
jgi:hypothetical protein